MRVLTGIVILALMLAVGCLARGMPAATGAGDAWYRTLSAELAEKGLPSGQFAFPTAEATFKAFRLYGQQVDRAKIRPIEGPEKLPARHARRIEIERPTQNYWSVAYGLQGPRAVQAGDTALLVMYLRSGGSREAAAVQFRPEVKADDGKGNFATVASRGQPRPEWTRTYLPIRFERAADAGKWKIELFVGGPTQVLEFAGMALLFYGDKAALDKLPRTEVDYDYAGRSRSYDDDISWLKEARQRIERHRKGDLTVRVVDAAGRPVPAAAVRAKMTRHAFLFGSVIETGRTPGADQDTYEKTFLELFNTATIGTFKWDPWRGNWPGPTKPEDTLAILDWCEQQGLYVHGHTLLWHQYGVMPFKQGVTPVPEMKSEILKWLDSVLTIPQVRKQVDSWDVINHPIAYSDVWRDIGRDFLLVELRKYVEHVPSHKRIINEGGILPRGASQHSQFHELVAWLLDNKAPIEGVGFMGHFSTTDLTPPEELWKRLEDYARLGRERNVPLSLRITEFDVSGEGNDPEQVAVQADYTRDFYTLLFSHPTTDGIIAWGFWEGRMWKPSAAWYAKDWKLRPNGQAYHDLVKGRWWTDARGTTAAQGEYRTRGFLGDYEITVTHGDKSKTVTATLPKEGRTLVVTLG